MQNRIHIHYMQHLAPHFRLARECNSGIYAICARVMKSCARYTLSCDLKKGVVEVLSKYSHYAHANGQLT